MFQFRIIPCDDGTDIIDPSLKTPYDSLTPSEMVEYMEVDSAMHYIGIMRKREQRTAQGVYHDYMVIETADGNEWLLDDSKGSPYIKGNHAVFQQGEAVLVVFDTRNTADITDDVIVEVSSV